jgi:hypothetical protein
MRQPLPRHLLAAVLALSGSALAAQAPVLPKAEPPKAKADAKGAAPATKAAPQEPVHVWAESVRYEIEKKKDAPSPISVGDVLQWPAFCTKLSQEGAAEQVTPGKRLWALLAPEAQALVRQGVKDGGLDDKGNTSVVQAINQVLKQPDFHQEPAFAGLVLPDPAKELLARDRTTLSEKDVETLNVLLFEAAFAREVAIHKGRVYVTGKATIIKKDLRIDSDRFLGYLDENNQFKRMVATGDVHITAVLPVSERTTERPPLQPTPEPNARRAVAHVADYLLAANLVVLSGNPEEPDVQPIVWINKDEVHADRIVFDQRQNLTTFEGRVKLSAITPKGEGKGPGLELPIPGPPKK